jgi:NodT family efflux transporter outer membrane factor (OMF) lipoprotein
MPHLIRTLRRSAPTLLGLALASCNLAPAYHVPATAPLPATFKSAPGWVPAAPAEAAAKGDWWTLFDDPVLDKLCARVEVNNQNVAYYRAAYAQARAAVREQRAALFPTVSASGSATKSGSFGSGSSGTITTGTATGTTTSSANRATVSIGASWEPDLWGKLANGVRQARASAEAGAGDFANATLSARGELATNYFQLRGIDAQKALLDEQITAYARAATITRNKFAAGTVARSDVYQAETTLANTQASRRDLDRQRTALEDAIAVLVGENPSTFTLAAAPWSAATPDIPGVLPAAILQRRPDVAAAERRVAAANAAIGIQRAAYFPDVTLTGSASSSAASFAGLFSAASSFWSLGASVAETLLDFGARGARVAQARAQFDQAAATYRQTVLTAFQQVEDNLSALDSYGLQMSDRARAADAATRAETIFRNQYLAGTVDYTSVTTAAAAALSARQSLITTTVDRQVAAVALVQAIGGSWTDAAPDPANRPRS